MTSKFETQTPRNAPFLDLRIPFFQTFSLATFGNSSLASPPRALQIFPSALMLLSDGLFYSRSMLQYKCRKPCEKTNLECSKEHKCEKYCFENCGKCKVSVDFTLVCGHQYQLECSTDLERIKCHQRCTRKCADCNVSCKKKCFEDCKPCKNKVCTAYLRQQISSISLKFKILIFFPS